MKFDLFYQSSFIGSTTNLEINEAVANLKLHILELVEVNNLDNLTLILKNYGIVSSEAFNALTFGDLGLAEKNTYDIIVINKEKDNTFEFDLKEGNFNNKQSTCFLLSFCTKFINNQESKINQPCFNIENKDFCLCCAAVCQRKLSFYDESKNSLQSKEFICECTKSNLKCFFNNIEVSSILEDPVIEYKNEVHKEEVDKANISLNTYKKFKEQQLLKEKTLNRVFDFERSYNYSMTRIQAYDKPEVIDALKLLFKDELLNKLREKAKEEYNEYTKFILTGSGFSEYNLRKHNEAIKFRNDISSSKKLDLDDCFIKALLHWFKNDFFSWCDAPICNNSDCKSKNIKGKYSKTDTPNEEEKQGQASRVEIFDCPNCGSQLRFPRYNNPINLITSRTGRCGEWANLFGAIISFFGYNTRFVENFEDHVWNEYYSKHQKRWIHLDSCENAYDTPLVYEQGWGRNMTFIIACSKDGMYDVTRRYVKDFEVINERRSNANKISLEKQLLNVNNYLRSSMDFKIIEEILERDEKEKLELENKLDLLDQLENKDNFKERESGSVDWKKQRGEMK